MEEKTYSIGQVANILKTEAHTIRYIESILEVKPKRDNNHKRYYNNEDINKIESIIRLRDQGLNYAAIKTVLNAKEEIVASATNQENTEPNTLSATPKSIEQFGYMLQKMIASNMSNIISPKLNEIESKIDELAKKNEQILNAEKQQEKHYKEIDLKLTILREEKKALNKEPWYLKVFKKK